MRHLSMVGGQSERGATLVELFITLVLLGIILGAVCTSFVSQRKAAAVHSQRVVLIQQAQAAMDLLTRELRRAGTNPTGTAFPSGTYPVTYSATQLEIRANLDNSNNNTTDPDEHLIYAYDTTTKRITRDAGNGAQPLVENIRAFTFQYLDGTGNPTTDSSKIRQLQLCITAQTAAADPRYTASSSTCSVTASAMTATIHGYRTFTMTSLINLRN
jgi:type IV pilus assembly protein PilW